MPCMHCFIRSNWQASNCECITQKVTKTGLISYGHFSNLLISYSYQLFSILMVHFITFLSFFMFSGLILMSSFLVAILIWWNSRGSLSFSSRLWTIGFGCKGTELGRWCRLCLIFVSLRNSMFGRLLQIFLVWSLSCPSFIIIYP